MNFIYMKKENNKEAKHDKVVCITRSFCTRIAFHHRRNRLFRSVLIECFLKPVYKQRSFAEHFLGKGEKLYSQYDAMNAILAAHLWPTCFLAKVSTKSVKNDRERFLVSDSASQC